MDQPRHTDVPKPEPESLGARLGKGFAVDLVFGLVLLIAFSAVGDFGLAFLLTLGGLAAAYVTIRHFLTRDDEPPQN